MKLPIKLHSGLKAIITQPYGSVSNVDWYRANNLNIPFHNGTDIVLSGTNGQTYGTALITPSEGWRVVKITFESPMSTSGNGVVLECQPFIEDGIKKVLQLTYWHCSEVLVNKDILPAGTTVAYMGNSGLVSPKPTPEEPYKGSHLHLMLREYHVINGTKVLQNADNGVQGNIDPMSRFSIADVELGSDTGIEKDLPPLLWAFATRGLKDNFSKIIFAIKNWWNGK